MTHSERRFAFTCQRYRLFSIFVNAISDIFHICLYFGKVAERLVEGRRHFRY